MIRQELLQARGVSLPQLRCLGATRRGEVFSRLPGGSFNQTGQGACAVGVSGNATGLPQILATCSQRCLNGTLDPGLPGRWHLKLHSRLLQVLQRLCNTFARPVFHSFPFPKQFGGHDFPVPLRFGALSAAPSQTRHGASMG